MYFLRFVILFIAVYATTNVYSQITSSPYSTFGVGTIENKGFGTNKGMGGVGIALQSKNYLNNKNPASYSGIDSLSFIFEIGTFMKNTTYSTDYTSESQFDANIRYLAIGFRLKRYWATSIGIAPFSSVGYTINNSNTTNEEFGSLNTTYTGSGGLNQIYLSNSFKINDAFSAGINTSYIFGTIDHNENAYIENFALDYDMNRTQRITGVLVDVGLQYSFEKSGYKYLFGATYGFKNKLNANTDNTFFGADSVETELNSTESNFYMPNSFGLGLAVIRNKKLTLAFDYEYTGWANINFSNELLDTRNSNKLVLGAEYSNPRSIMIKGLKACSYRLGMNYNSSYLQIDNIPINSKSVSMGVGIPIRYDRSKINLSVEYGINGTTSNSLIEEKYWMVHLNFTLHDMWFNRNKYIYK